MATSTTATVDAIMTAMVSGIQDWANGRGTPVAVYLIEAPADECVAQYAVQVVPGADTASHPVSGVGLVRSAVDVVVWWRGFTDPSGRADQRLGGPEGIQIFVNELREQLVQQKYAGMAIALTYRNGGTAEKPSDLNGWVTIRDSYEYGYIMNWTVKP